MFRAAKIRVVADGGAYCSVTPWVTWRSTVQCCGPYSVENVHCDVFGVYTNNVFSGAMRGFGSPQMNFAVEQMIELAASELGVSSIELRKKNMVRQGATTITGQVLDNHRVSMEEVLLTALEKSDYETKLKSCSRGESEGEYLYGIGLAMSYRGMSIGAEGKDFTSAIINVQFDGSVLLEVGIHENGQGSETAMTLLLAEELGIEKERIRYRQYSTSNIPDGGTTVASRGTLMGGGAVTNAARALKKQMGELLAEQLGCDGDSVLFEGGRISSPDGSKSMSFEEAVHQLYLMQEYPYAFETFKAPAVSWDEETGRGNAYITWVYGAQVVELEVQKKSGKVKILQAYAVHDVGRAINRHGVLGQYYGGMAMGLGYALHEDFVVDKGVPAQLNFDKYRIPRAKDVPPMHAFIIEHSDPVSPSGAKGIGEPTCEIMAPAVANAIFNATGKRVFHLPIKAEVK